MQTFIKTINYSHLMPTRYNLADVDLKGTVSGEALENASAKKSANQVRAAAPSRSPRQRRSARRQLRSGVCAACDGRAAACRRRRSCWRRSSRRARTAGSSPSCASEHGAGVRLGVTAGVVHRLAYVATPVKSIAAAAACVERVCACGLRHMPWHLLCWNG